MGFKINLEAVLCELLSEHPAKLPRGLQLPVPRRCCQQAASCLAALTLTVGIKALQITENKTAQRLEEKGNSRISGWRLQTALRRAGTSAGTERGLQMWTKSQRLVSSGKWCSGFLHCFVIHKCELR